MAQPAIRLPMRRDLGSPKSTANVQNPRVGTGAQDIPRFRKPEMRK